MKITYDAEADAVYIKLNDNELKSSKVINDRVRLAVDTDGQVAGIELMNASKFVTAPNNVEFQDITRHLLSEK